MFLFHCPVRGGGAAEPRCVERKLRKLKRRWQLRVSHTTHQATHQTLGNIGNKIVMTTIRNIPRDHELGRECSLSTTVFKTQPEQESDHGKEAELRKKSVQHKKWPAVWRPSHAGPDVNQKRFLEDPTLVKFNQKRRSTSGLLYKTRHDEKENEILEVYRRESHITESSKEYDSLDDKPTRQGLTEMRHRNVIVEIVPNLSDALATSKSHSIKVDEAEPEKRIIAFHKLSLTDEALANQTTPVLPLAEDLTCRAVAKKPSSVKPRPKLYLVENTRLLGSMFYRPVTACLEPDVPHKPWSILPDRLERESAVCNVDPLSGPHLRRPHSFWLPHTLVDECRLDEFHQNHESIYRYIYARDLELNSYFCPDFMKKNGLTEEIRGTLCDWMIKVQQYLKLRTETLHLAVSLVDRYTWLVSGLNPSDYQLVGITTLFVAAKFVERFAPATKTLCYLTENSYKPKQVLQFEAQLLRIVDFELAIPLPHHFLTRALLASSDLTSEDRMKLNAICGYLFELSLTETAAVSVPASIKCAAAVRLARALIQLEKEATQSSPVTSSLGEPESTNVDIQSPDMFSASSYSPIEQWPEVLALSTGYQDDKQLGNMVDIYISALSRFIICGPTPSTKYEAAHHKFSNRAYRCIAKSSTLLYCTQIKEHNTPLLK